MLHCETCCTGCTAGVGLVCTHSCTHWDAWAGRCCTRGALTLFQPSSCSHCACWVLRERVCAVECTCGRCGRVHLPHLQQRSWFGVAPRVVIPWMHLRHSDARCMSSGSRFSVSRSCCRPAETMVPGCAQSSNSLEYSKWLLHWSQMLAMMLGSYGAQCVYATTPCEGVHVFCGLCCQEVEPANQGAI